MRVPVYDREVLPTSPAGGVGIRLEDTGVGGGLQSLGRALGRVADSLGYIAQKRREADNAIKLTEADTGASRELAELRARLGEEALKPGEPGAPKPYESVGPVRRGSRQDPRPLAGDDSRRPQPRPLQLRPRTEVAVRRPRAEARRRPAARRHGGGDDERRDRRAGARRRRRAERGRPQRRQAVDRDAIDAAWQAGAINDVDRGKTLRAALHNVDETTVLREGQLDPEATLARLADPKNYPDLDPERRQRLAAQMEDSAYSRKERGEHETQTKQTDIKQRASMGRAMLDGVVPDGLDDLAREADAAGLPEVATALRDRREDVGYFKDLKPLPPDKIREAAERDRKRAQGERDATQVERLADRAKQADTLAAEKEKTLGADLRKDAQNAIQAIAKGSTTRSTS